MERRLGWRGPLGWLCIAALVAGFVFWGSPAQATGKTVLSLLAVGDTGKPAAALPWLDPARRVAKAMAAEDRRAPVDGLVLLGDNFYPDGLAEEEFESRLRSDLVERFCHFIALTALGRKSLGNSCADGEDPRHPVPLYAVLGNHDYGERESPRLERDGIPEYLAGWRMPRHYVALHELPGGVSLVLLDSMPSVKGDRRRELEKTLRRARGPWRILATHYPLADGGDGNDGHWARQLSRVLEETGVPIDLHLAGHVHNLQVLRMAPPRPPLQVLAGSGSNVRAVEETGEQRIFAAAALGFVRVDLVRESAGEHLRLSVYTVDPAGPDGFAPGQPAARVELDADGTVRSEVGTRASRSRFPRP